MKSETVCELKTAEDLLKLNWFELEIFKSAFHEAAHAVIARLTGFEVAWVSLDADFIGNDPLAIQNRSGHGRLDCWRISGSQSPPRKMAEIRAGACDRIQQFDTLFERLRGARLSFPSQRINQRARRKDPR